MNPNIGWTLNVPNKPMFGTNRTSAEHIRPSLVISLVVCRWWVTVGPQTVFVFSIYDFLKCISVLKTFSCQQPCSWAHARTVHSFEPHCRPCRDVTSDISLRSMGSPWCNVVVVVVVVVCFTVVHLNSTIYCSLLSAKYQNAVTSNDRVDFLVFCWAVME